MSDNFYRSFEDRHRGSFDLIKSRLTVYLPFIRCLQTQERAINSLDLGCGRGEWLLLMGEVGVDAVGVDLDDGMLSGCQALELKTFKQDALVFLKEYPSSSLDVITGFHIAEHITFGELSELFTESLRVLRPGGLLVMETPNPENLIVGTSSFYLDPTHIKPIPPMLLTFLAEYSGFSRVKLVRLNESKDILTKHHATLMEVLDGVSPDYSIIAQKYSTEIDANLNILFEKNYGIGLGDLCNKFDQRHESYYDALNALRQRVESIQEDIQHIRIIWILVNPFYRIYKAFKGLIK
jgi:O-antigen chain-terminating methyltransferase